MRYESTRGRSAPLSFSEAVVQGLAPDGGLYVPGAFPRFSTGDFHGLTSLPEIAARFLAPFLEGDALRPHLPEICAAALSFPVLLRRLTGDTTLLELFHGPTAAFKDVGARFLAECLARLPGRLRTILVATSGDTGGAVAGAFFAKPGFEVVILFPKSGVSKEQEMQLTTWGGNVRAFAVSGSFDDCQHLVKEAFQDEALRKEKGLTSANSINLGRLLPQAAYYAAAALWSWREEGSPPGFVVPAGNLGNALACFWARASGLPVRHVALASNANRAIPDFYRTGEFEPQPTVQTLANAMDVGNPSNLERLRVLFRDDGALRRASSAVSVSDEAIRETLKLWRDRNEVFCPHTATALYARERLPEGQWIVVATAHPGKFRTVLAPIVGAVPLPPALEALLSQPSHTETLGPEISALRRKLRD